MTAPEPSLRRTGVTAWWHTVRRVWPVVVAVILAAAALGWLLASHAKRSYVARSDVLIADQQSVDVLLGSAVTATDPARDLNTNVKLVRLEPVADSVRRTLGLPASSQDLLTQVSASLDGDTNIVAITARDADPQRAARIANAFAAAYLRFDAVTARSTIDRALRAGQDRLRRLGPGGAQTPLGRRLTAAAERLQVVGAFRTGDARLLRRATVPTAPAGLGRVTAALLAAVVGALLAAAAIAVWTRLDSRLRDEDDVERAIGPPVLTSVPAARGRPGRGAGARRASPAVEAYTTLAARLAFSRGDFRPKVLLIASPGGGEGAPAVAFGLTAALGALGMDTIAIEADLREPSFQRTLRVDGRPGLSGVLTGRRSLDDELVELPGSSPASGRVCVLPAGAPWPEPQALLSSPALVTAVGQARRQAAYVLICGPPLTHPGDAFALSRVADGAVLVVHRGHTTSEAAQHAVRTLEQVELPLAAVALIEAPSRAGRQPIDGDSSGGAQMASSRSVGGAADTQVVAT